MRFGRGLILLLCVILLSSSVSAFWPFTGNAVTDFSCDDTDNGRNIGVKGTVSGIRNGEAFSYTDSCERNYVKEYFCFEDYRRYEYIKCDNGCSNGKCVGEDTTVRTTPGIQEVVKETTEEDFETISLCELGTSRCSGSGYELCVDANHDGTEEWVYYECESGSCLDGDCVDVMDEVVEEEVVEEPAEEKPKSFFKILISFFIDEEEEIVEPVKEETNVWSAIPQKISETGIQSDLGIASDGSCPSGSSRGSCGSGNYGEEWCCDSGSCYDTCGCLDGDCDNAFFIYNGVPHSCYDGQPCSRTDDDCYPPESYCTDDMKYMVCGYDSGQNGYYFYFAGNDPDGDGWDSECGDLCPQNTDAEPENWCPDTDGDGTPVNNPESFCPSDVPDNYIGCGGNDECPDDPNKIEPGECGCGTPDNECCNNKAPFSTSYAINSERRCTQGETQKYYECSNGGWVHIGTDDGDAIDPECGIDNCPNDANKYEPGVCGCGEPETDANNDGIIDCGTYCGDGIANNDEECDGNNLNGFTCADFGYLGGTLGCYNDCTFALTECSMCGDNIANNDEPCDGTDLNGATCENLIGGDGELSCLSDCSNWDMSGCYICGNGIIESEEECDDGDTENGDGCDANCIIEYCGDIIVNNIDEECDDGNAIDGDGCQADCMLPVCGDGIVDSDEECDDGNTNNGDGCSSICTIECPEGDACDDGDLCTENDVCGADGSCSGTPKNCVGQCGQCYFEGCCDNCICERSTGECIVSNPPPPAPGTQSTQGILGIQSTPHFDNSKCRKSCPSKPDELFPTNEGGDCSTPSKYCDKDIKRGSCEEGSCKKTTATSCEHGCTDDPLECKECTEHNHCENYEWECGPVVNGKLSRTKNICNEKFKCEEKTESRPVNLECKEGYIYFYTSQNICENGEWDVEEVNCKGDTPKCINGKCVQCTDKTHCKNDGDPYCKDGDIFNIYNEICNSNYKCEEKTTTIDNTKRCNSGNTIVVRDECRDGKKKEIEITPCLGDTPKCEDGACTCNNNDDLCLPNSYECINDIPTKGVCGEDNTCKALIKPEPTSPKCEDEIVKKLDGCENGDWKWVAADNCKQKDLVCKQTSSSAKCTCPTKTDATKYLFEKTIRSCVKTRTCSNGVWSDWKNKDDNNCNCHFDFVPSRDYDWGAYGTGADWWCYVVKGRGGSVENDGKDCARCQADGSCDQGTDYITNGGDCKTKQTYNPSTTQRGASLDTSQNGYVLNTQSNDNLLNNHNDVINYETQNYELNYPVTISYGTPTQTTGTSSISGILEDEIDTIEYLTLSFEENQKPCDFSVLESQEFILNNEVRSITYKEFSYRLNPEENLEEDIIVKINVGSFDCESARKIANSFDCNSDIDCSGLEGALCSLNDLNCPLKCHERICVKKDAIVTKCSTNADCDDGNLCTTNTCEAGICLTTNNNFGCDDNNACTFNDKCSNGICQGTQMTCDDGIECTIDSCNNGICINDDTNCAICNSNSECNDNNVCTTDICAEGKCQYTNVADGTYCGNRKKIENKYCYDGVCQESCAGEGEISTLGIGASSQKCCQGLQRMELKSDGTIGLQGLCYNPNKGEPECKATGTRSEGWYYTTSNELIRYDSCGCSTSADCPPPIIECIGSYSYCDKNNVCQEKCAAYTEGECRITNIYALETSNEAYFNLFLETSEYKDAQKYSIVGAGIWDDLEFKYDQYNQAFVAVKDLNKRAVNYLRDRAYDIKLVDENGDVVCYEKEKSLLRKIFFFI